MDMNSVLQLINDKLAKTVLSNQTQFTVAANSAASSAGTSAAGPPASTTGLPCNLPPMIPFSVPASFRFRSKEETTMHRLDGAEATLCLQGEKKDRDEKGGDGVGRAPVLMMNGGGPRTSITTDNARKYNTRFMEYYGTLSLGRIDPRLYKKTDDEDDDYEVPDNHVGRIWFGVEYEQQTEKLMVTLIKARNLSGRLGSTNPSGGDHFVRVYLLPDERRYLQSKFKKKASNPQFEESFVFQVSNKTLEERVLKLTVFEADRHKRHVVVGHALYPMKDHYGNEKVVLWRDLERELTETTLESGEILVSLCYKTHLERLTVGIFEGKNIKMTDDHSLPDVYVKVSLLLQSKVMKTKKTEVIRRSVNPSFNESFTFKLAPDSLDAASITITAMQNNTAHVRDRMIGRVVVGSFMFSRGKELDHWNKMAASSPEQVLQWHHLM